MIIAFFILLGVALVLGGVIVYLVVSDKKKNAAKDFEVPAEVLEEFKQPEEQPAPVEEVAEPASEEVEEPAVVEEVPAVVEEENDDEEITRVKTVVEDDGNTRYIVIKYSKSFLAKLIQSSEETKNYYSEIKNCLLSYDGVKSRVSWKWETFRAGRKILVKLRLRGKTLSVAYALDPAEYNETKYHVEDISDIKSYAETPCLYRIKNDRRLKYSQDLIATLMERNGLNKKENAKSTDYVKQHPYETTEALIERKLIKELTDEEAQSGTVFKPAEIRQSVTAKEVDAIMTDEIAATAIENADGISDKTKVDIVNIDTLSQYFNDGEIVTLAEIKKRVKGFNKKTTYLKVLARGTLDKKLIVEADSFSLQAVKMIVLTGGKVIKK